MPEDYTEVFLLMGLYGDENTPVKVNADGSLVFEPPSDGG